MTVNLLDFDLPSLEAWFASIGEKPFRARQVMRWVHRAGVTGIGQMTDLSRGLRESLEASAQILPPAVRLDSVAPDGTRKWLFDVGAGNGIETVFIPETTRGTLCISSQVGCALACAFCATGRMGFFRNLETWEIVEQVRLLRASEGLGAPRRIHGVVFQGMGEPLLNLDRVIEAVRVMSEPSGLAIDMKAMTVCTSGIPEGIRRLAVELPKVRVGLSIGNARSERRASLMPVERVHPIAETIEALALHARETGLKPLVAYTPLEGVNDGDADADALAALLARFSELAGTTARLTLIPYNRENEADPFERQSSGSRARFFGALRARGLHPHIRASRGRDIAAACGQLRHERVAG